MGDSGAMGGRTAGRPRQGREMGSVHLFDFNERDIPHTTGIHRIVVDRQKGKKGEKKRFHLLSPRIGEIGGLTFFQLFFQSWKKHAISKCSPVGTKRTYDVLVKTRKKRGGGGEL
jgi:hypothetical protein